jgi:NADPH-dependent 2,4-dienoyl-CoA reductase/sulfur reductase-like enzyme
VNAVGGPMNVVILGNGIAGVTCALALRKRRPDWRITLVSGESDAFFSRTALMYIYMGHMRLSDTQPYEERVWKERRIERVRGWVGAVDVKNARLEFTDGRTLAWDRLVLATGSEPNRFGWPGQDLPGVQGLYSLQDLELLEANSKGLRNAVIVGGGLIGIELAEMLHSRGVHVTILAREAEYWSNALPVEEARLVGRVIREAGIDLRLSSAMRHVEAGANGRATAIVTESGDRIECGLVGLTAGVRPNLSALADKAVPTGRGVLVDALLRTRVEGIYACGDCAEIVEDGGERGRVEQLWYTGRMHGEVVAENLAGGERRYERGIWFNSAKFMDLEWHTYGQVAPGAAPAANERHLWWAHPSGRHALRIVERDGAVIGMNALGWRHRQDVWTRWIAERRSLSDVVKNLRAANFDPEFFRRFEGEIVAAARGLQMGVAA